MGNGALEGLGVGLLAMIVLSLLRAGRLGGAVAIWIGWVGLSNGLTPVETMTRESRRESRIVFLDVGQGDAGLIQTPSATFMIDAGGGRPGRDVGRAVARATRAIGVRRVDVLAVTHGDFDHRGGADRLIEAGRVGALWLPALGRRDPALVALAERATARRTDVRWLGEGDRLRLGASLAVDVLWPPASPASGDPVEGRNDASLVLRVVAEDVVSLWMADVGAAVEVALLGRGTRLVADVLKVGHHGSAGSSSAEFLAAVRPRLAVLSAPCLPTRGLPAPAIHARLTRFAEAVAWTGRDGAVEVGSRRGGRALAWRGSAPARPCLPPSEDSRVHRESAAEASPP